MDLIKFLAGRSWISVHLGSAPRGGGHGGHGDGHGGGGCGGHDHHGHGLGHGHGFLCAAHMNTAQFLPCPAAALLGSGPSVQAQGEVSQQPNMTHTRAAKALTCCWEALPRHP